MMAHKFIWIFLIAILFESCLEELPYGTTLRSQSFVVNGGVNNLKENQTIRLSKTLAYGVPPAPVSGAQVKVIENNTKEYLFSENKSGEYILNKDKYDPKIGATYAIRISYNGQNYQSTPEEMLPPIVPDSITWTVKHETVLSSAGIPRVIDGVQLYVHTPILKGDKNINLKWDVQTAFQFTTITECNPFKTVYTCYFGKTLNPSQIRIYSNEDNGVSYLDGEDVGYENLEIGYQFLENHYYSVYQYRLSKFAFEYYRKLRLVSEQNGTIFDPIPASVNSNVYNPQNKSESILGLFQVASVAVIRKRVVESDFRGLHVLPTKNFDYCGWRNGNNPNSTYFPACCDCNQLKDPKISKPDWWN